MAVKAVHFRSELPPWAPPQQLEARHAKLLREVRQQRRHQWTSRVDCEVRLAIPSWGHEAILCRCERCGRFLLVLACHTPHILSCFHNSIIARVVHAL